MADALRLLFVEDEPDIRQIVEIALSRDNAFAITAFSSAEAALESLIATPRTFDLALLDMMLPKMSGQQLHAALRSLPFMGDLRAVFLTASMGPAQAAGYAANGIKVIAKPFSVVALPDTLRNFVDATDL